MTNLTQQEKDKFLSDHLPHRLTLLRTLRQRVENRYNFTNNGDIYRCLKDSNLITVRLFLDFFGLKGKLENGIYELISIKSKRQDDVRIDEFIGHLLKPTDVPQLSHRILAGVYVRADKELAHLTTIFNDEFNEEKALIEAATIVEDLIKRHLYDYLGKQLPKMNL